jgi:glycosyltransferase involved in cell wall biosynthesis
MPVKSMGTMKLLYLCGKERSYIRNVMMMKGLRNCGCEIIDCSDESRTYLRRFLNSLFRFFASGKAGLDFVFIGCLGHYYVPLIRRVTAKPLIFDPFVSMYDTMCLDRKRFRPDSAAGRVLHWLDRTACTQADRILLDTDAHIDYFARSFALPREKFLRVLVGADESIFYPRESRPEDGRFHVFYYSSFLPLHGTEYVVQAAAALRAQGDIAFTVVGSGLEHAKVRSLAKRLGVDNVRFIDWLPYEELPLEIGASDICLGGHFSDIDKARRVIAGKTYQFIAMRKPVIVGDCPANREIFSDRQNAFMVRMADADSLAEAILELRENKTLREKIAEEGYTMYLEKCTTAAIGRTLEGLFNNPAAWK